MQHYLKFAYFNTYFSHISKTYAKKEKYLFVDLHTYLIFFKYILLFELWPFRDFLRSRNDRIKNRPLLNSGAPYLYIFCFTKSHKPFILLHTFWTCVKFFMIIFGIFNHKYYYVLLLLFNLYKLFLVRWQFKFQRFKFRQFKFLKNINTTISQTVI